MKKTNTINLGGVIFHIEEDAFTLLQKYLSSIKDHFSESEGQEEIVTDIEARIAEIFQEKKVKIISSDHVEEVIKIMGQPEEYGDEGADDDKISDDPSLKEKVKRRVYRHPTDKILGGVCVGLGVYFNVDPVLFRLGFLVSMFLGGFGLLMYLVLWLIVPVADTTSDKLKMKGEPITADSIGKAITAQVEKAIDPETSQNALKIFFKWLGNAVRFVFDILVKLTKVLGFVLKPLLGIGFLIFGLSVTIAFSFLLLVLSGTFGIFHHDFSGAVHTLKTVFETYPLPEMFVLLGFILLVGIPIFQIIYVGLRLLFNMAKQPNYIKGTLASLWILGLISVIVFGLYSISVFSEDARKDQFVELIEVKSDTLNISLLPHIDFYWEDRDLKIIDSEDSGYTLNSSVQLDVRRSTDSLFHLQIRKHAMARSYKEAKKYAENIDYNYILKEGELLLDQFFIIPADDPYQHQEIELTLLIPNDKSIYLDETLKYFIDDIRNVTRTRDYKMVEHIWQMRAEGLTCLDCN
ncbi:MAG: PspC domain-containing protein [Candidatus Marinimicrobia bacterium]|nr:PspC domain-containing protein [Candidatus Neomarinimicrobiota bacterium]